MLNIGKLAAGGEGYYLESVASGVEDYYTGAGEAPGYWLGAAAGELGLAGQVDAEALRAVLAARHPDHDERLSRAGHRRIPGFDCTFRAPKSVSLLYGLADADTSRVVREAHDVAVAAAIGYLEEQAGWSRRGVDGAERVQTSGLVAAAFRHRTSRAGDPLLHTHVLIANLAQTCDDGVWRTLDARHLYVHAKTAGYLYQAQLRAELTRRLGVEWAPVANGSADLAGVPKEVLRAFSRRRAEIEAHMHARGESSAKAAQMATLATRNAKDHTVEPAALAAGWQARAAALGFDDDAVAALTGPPREVSLSGERIEAVFDELAGPAGLTATASTFTRRDVIQAWCDRLGEGADITQILTLADATLTGERGLAIELLDPDRVTQRDVIRRRDGRLVPVRDEARYSTSALLALEHHAITTALARTTAGAGRADEQHVSAALARRPSITGEQAAMVHRLATSGAGVEVVIGKAGAGKTYALDAARHAWQASGHRVIGAALAARAAAELHAGAGIDSYTLAGLLADLDRPDHRYHLTANTVIVVDEAGMAGTRTLARLLDHAHNASAKVVLVGDDHQLPEIDAGGLFRGLTQRLPAIELVDNRRQQHHWERAALDELRHGNPAAALHAYTTHGRIVIADSAEAVRERLIEDWWQNRQTHGANAQVMIAARRSDVEDLNTRARARLAAAGDLHGPTLTAAGREFQAGDQVLALRNDRRLGITNGTRGTIHAIDHDTATVQLRVDAGRCLTLPAAYLDAGHLTHAYAITGHKAQGLTTEHTFVLGTEALYREWGYLALSRGRDSNRLYLVAGDDPARDPTHQAAAERDPLLDAARSLQRSRAQRLATDHPHPEPADEHLEPADEHLELADEGLRATRNALRDRLQRGLPPPVDSQLSRLEHARTHTRQQLHDTEARRDAAHHTLADARSGLGRLTRRDEQAQARRDLARLEGDVERWRDHLDDLDAEHAEVQHRARQQSDWITAHADDLATYHDLSQTLDTRGQQRLRAAQAQPPTDVLRLLGPPPDTPSERDAWRDGVHAIEDYRTRWGIEGDTDALDQPTKNLEQQRDRNETLNAVQRTRQQLSRGDDCVAAIDLRSH